jgi:PAS domain-containing protein
MTIHSEWRKPKLNFLNVPELLLNCLPDLTLEANILFASESIVDILGYQPYEVIGRSCFEYFHANDIPFTCYGHNQNLRLDKAAVLYYARIRAKNNQWVSCECVFTVVHDVLVACTSIYRGDHKSQRRFRL